MAEYGYALAQGGNDGAELVNSVQTRASGLPEGKDYGAQGTSWDDVVASSLMLPEWKASSLTPEGGAGVPSSPSASVLFSF
jgi:hypothetical protein